MKLKQLLKEYNTNSTSNEIKNLISKLQNSLKFSEKNKVNRQYYTDREASKIMQEIEDLIDKLTLTLDEKQDDNNT